MTDDRMALVDLLQKSGDGDFLRSVAEAVLQILMEADVEGLIGAGRHERTGDRLNYRNGYRDRSLDTQVTVAQRWEDMMIVVAGGPGKHSMYIPTFGGTRAVTQPIVHADGRPYVPADLVGR